MCCCVIFVLCSLIITNALCSAITRDKRQTFELYDRWIWGYDTEKPIQENPRLQSINNKDETIIKFILSTNEKVIESTSHLLSTTGTSVSPFTSEIEATTTTETKSKDISSTTESVFIKAARLPPDIRILNASTTIEENVTTDIELETTTLPSYCARQVKPDYSRTGRRINEAQCMGYIWEMYNRKRENDIKQDCGLMYMKASDRHRVIGGRKTEHGEFPHMGAIGWKAAVGTWVFKCGSSLISPKFVLTAGHCSRASPRDSSISDPVPKIVRLGDKRITDKQGSINVVNLYLYPTDRNIIRIITHPNYKPPMKYNDIALMELDKPVAFSNLIQPACLWTYFSMGDAQTATLTGWGVIETGGLSLEASPELMAASVDLLDNDQCDELLKNNLNRNWHGFQEHQLCAGKLIGGVDSCQGDSGGPLQMPVDLPSNLTATQGQMHYVAGIISFGIGCAQKNLPGIYTRVSSFLDWIEDNVWNNETPTPNDLSTDFQLFQFQRSLL